MVFRICMKLRLGDSAANINLLLMSTLSQYDKRLIMILWYVFVPLLPNVSISYGDYYENYLNGLSFGHVSIEIFPQPKYKWNFLLYHFSLSSIDFLKSSRTHLLPICTWNQYFHLPVIVISIMNHFSTLSCNFSPCFQAKLNSAPFHDSLLRDY